jgi:uncharacterized protein YoxC
LLLISRVNCSKLRFLNSGVTKAVRAERETIALLQQQVEQLQRQHENVVNKNKLLTEQLDKKKKELQLASSRRSTSATVSGFKRTASAPAERPEIEIVPGPNHRDTITHTAVPVPNDNDNWMEIARKLKTRCAHILPFPYKICNLQ